MRKKKISLLPDGEIGCKGHEVSVLMTEFWRVRDILMGFMAFKLIDFEWKWNLELTYLFLIKIF